MAPAGLCEQRIDAARQTGGEYVGPCDNDGTFEYRRLMSAIGPAPEEGSAKPLVVPLSIDQVQTRIWTERRPVLRRLLQVVGVGYLPVALSHFVFLPDVGGQIVCFFVAIMCSITLLLGARYLRADRPRPASPHYTLIALFYACVAVHSLVRLHFSHTTGDMMFVGALTVAMALVPSPQRVHAVAIALYVTGWSAQIVSLFDLQTWTTYIAPLIVTTTVSIVIRELQLRRESSIAELRIVDEARSAALEHEARHDALTGMANRALFRSRAERALERTRVGGGDIFAILFLDLDRFKVVNDSLGHAVGDRLLKAVGKRLIRFVRPGDTVARFGGDEFGVLLERLHGPSDALTVVERLEQVLDEPFVLDSYDVQVGASIGIAIYRPEYDSVEDMLRDADIAMYAAKRGRESFHLFDAEMHAQAVARLELEVELRGALKRGTEIVPHYQPIVDLVSGAVVGVEALARWEHPVRGTLTPAHFLSIAEETGLIYTLGQAVLARAVADLGRWRELELPIEFVSVNVSAREFAHTELESQIAALVRDLEPGQLWLEITESSVLEQPKRAAERIERLRQLGVRMCVDDFGVGYSSLSYLQRMSFDVLKLDRSFLTEGRSETFIRAVTQLAESLEMIVVAEGIEELDAVEVVRSLGCAFGQGWALGKPAPAAVIEGPLLAANSKREPIAE